MPFPGLCRCRAIDQIGGAVAARHRDGVRVGVVVHAHGIDEAGDHDVVIETHGARVTRPDLAWRRDARISLGELHRKRAGGRFYRSRDLRGLPALVELLPDLKTQTSPLHLGRQA